MPSISLLLVIYFLIVAFISGKPSQVANNSFLAYYGAQIQFILTHLLFFILFIVGVAFLFIRAGKQNGKVFKRFISKLAASLALGSLVSYILLFLIALIQMNVMSVLMTVNPKLIGVEANSKVIVDKLKESVSTPMIVSGNIKDRTLLPAVVTAQAGKNSFYGNHIISHAPTFLTIPTRETGSGVLMIGDTLVVTSINSQDFQEVSPIASYLMIKSYFPDRDIKSYPKVSLMDEKEYSDFRKRDFNEKLKLFGEVIAQIDEDDSSISATIEQEKTQIVENQESLDQARLNREKEYTKCVNTGYYQNGNFIKTNTKLECQEEVSSLDDLVKQVESEGENLKNSLEENQSKLEQYQAYLKFYKNQKLLTQEESNYISFEFATFNPPDEIKIAYTTKNDTEAVADYFELLIHEYLHYTTFNEEGKKLSGSFFPEGLTEYFARNIVKRNLGVDTNLGYPVNVKIIKQMTKRISDDDLAEIYFTYDEAGLEKLLNRVYGDDFFRNNQILLETIQYSSDTDQILKLANEVMVEMGGNPLNMGDVSTTYSTPQ